MLAELAAANAAFSILKKVVENGKDLANAGKAISDFTNAKDAIDKKARSQGSVNDPKNADLESFLARDKIKAQEDELRSMMQLYGRANMYPDYVRFCAEARKARIEAVKQAQREREQLIDTILVSMFWAACLGVAGAALFILIKVLLNV
tara:strand:- start:3363 stop:3809 length:447 start_codon:yes stop_codon:yes gene_type:complete